MEELAFRLSLLSVVKLLFEGRWEDSLGRREQSFPDKRRSMCVPPAIRFGEAQMEKDQ